MPAGSPLSRLSRFFGILAPAVLFLVLNPHASAQNISSLTPNSGPIGTSVTIAGSGFGASQGSSTVAFNGTNANPTSWSDTQIVAPVPSGATTGSVVVTVNGTASNGVNFTVTTIAPSLVSIAVSPNTASIAAGNTQPFDAVGTYSDNSTQDVSSTASWTSSDATVAVVDPSGNATALDNGQVTIQATIGSISGSATLTVTPGQLDAVITPVLNNGGYGAPNQKAIAVGSDGFTRFVTDDASGQVVFVHCLDQDCATSNTNTLSTGLVNFYSMSLGSDGFASIAYDIFGCSLGFRQCQSTVYFIQCSDTDCNTYTSAMVDTGSDNGVVSVATNNDGTSYVIYDDGNDEGDQFGQGIGLATCTSGACSTTHIASLDVNRTLMGAINVDANGNPVLVYNDSGNEAPFVPDTVHYYAGGTENVIYTNASQCCQMDVEVGPDGFGRVLFPGYAFADFVQCGDAMCGMTSVHDLPIWAEAESLAVAADGTPHIELGSRISGTTIDVDYILCAKPDCSVSSDQLVPGNWGNQYEVSVALDQNHLPRMIAQAQGNTQGSAGSHDLVRAKVPTSLSVVDTPTVLPDGPGPPDGCPGSFNYGIKIDLKYQVWDQEDPPQPLKSSEMIPHESGQSFKGQSYDNDIGASTGYPTSSKTTASDGTFHDVPLGFCLDVPIDLPGVVATQDITIIRNKKSYPVRSQLWTVTAPGTQSFGHGKIVNNIISPATGSDVSASR